MHLKCADRKSRGHFELSSEMLASSMTSRADLMLYSPYATEEEMLSSVSARASEFHVTSQAFVRFAGRRR